MFKVETDSGTTLATFTGTNSATCAQKCVENYMSEHVDDLAYIYAWDDDSCEWLIQ